jgi:RimJ/RimL family protein N-acetyltransferase
VELTGRGLGSEVLRRFVADVVFARPETTSCVADPDARNIASLRAFEKAGFRQVKSVVEPEDGQTHALVRLDRQGAQRAPR